MLNDNESYKQSKESSACELQVNNCLGQKSNSVDLSNMQPTSTMMDKPVSPRRSASLGSWRIVLMHAIFIALGWILFAWSWVLVLSRPIQTGNLWWLMGIASVLVPAITMAWIMHNVGINRRKGPRRAGRETPLVYEQDFHGHRIDADWDSLRAAQCVAIGLNDEGVKWYRAVRASVVTAGRENPVSSK